MRVESDFYPEAVSHKGAMGLMQLMPATARAMGVLDPFDPRQNILGGARFLRVLANRFGGDLVLTIAAYNAGEGAVAEVRRHPALRRDAPLRAARAHALLRATARAPRRPARTRASA